MSKRKQAKDKHAAKNLTFHPGILELAEALMALRRYSTLVSLVSELIREEYERRHGRLTFNPHAPPLPREASPPDNDDSMGTERRPKSPLGGTD